MRKKRKKTGHPPGHVIFTGNQKVDKIFIHCLQFDGKNLKQHILDNHAEIVFQQSPSDKIDWFDMRGIHDTELIQLFGQTFGIHSLVLEDVADVQQRPKFEEYDNGNFISIRALKFDKNNNKVLTEHVTIYFSKGFVATFQETESDLFHQLRQRIESGKGKIRNKGADYLAYAIVDVLVDQYYLVLEEMEEVIELLEDQIIANQDDNIKGEIHRLKKELLVLRKSIAPLREAIGRFSKTDSPFVEEGNLIFIRDLYDHTIQVMDMVESYRDMLNGLQDLYLTQVSFKMNKVMQLLTLISTIFIPLTFLAGIYGMNFTHMPELQWEYGYFFLLGIMAIIFVGLLVYFKKKKWI